MDRFIRENWRGGRGLVLRRKTTKKKKMITKRVKVSFPDSLKQKKIVQVLDIFLLLLLPKILPADEYFFPLPDESKISSSSSSSSFFKPSKPSNSEEEEEISTHSLKIPFFLHPHQHHKNHHSKHQQKQQPPPSSLVIPDFWSPLLSRRHVIDLEISLACNDDKNNPNYEVTKLRIPLQVCYGEVH